MSGARLLVLLLGIGWLAACTSTRTPAPVREIGKPVRPAPSARPVQPGQYVVRPGDTLFKIAFENSLDYRELALWNGLIDPGRIRVGQSLRLTPPTALAPAATPSVAAATPAPRTQPAPLPTEVSRWDWPARGPLLSSFDEASGRKGIQIAGPLGAPVHAAAAGRVVYAGDGLRGYGKLIIIKHSDAMLSAYAHHSRIVVQEGQSVVLGQWIGEMGDSDADRVKLHFEIRVQGKPVDPIQYLPASS